MPTTSKNQKEELIREGRWGSVQDPHWNGSMHECCGSKRAYYHGVQCPLVRKRLKANSNTSLVRVDPETGLEIRLNHHRRRKNHLLVAAMYAMYQTGKSLEQVAEKYDRTRQSIYELFRTRGYKLRSKPMRGLQILDGIQFTAHKAGHLRGTVNGVRMSMHHYVWEKYNGPVSEGHCVYHQDGNPANNEIENLRLLPKSKMGPTFNKHGHNQFSPGGSGIKRGERIRQHRKHLWTSL